MIKLSLIFLFCLSAILLQAQQDSLSVKATGYINKLDSIKIPIIPDLKAPSLTIPDSIKNPLSKTSTINNAANKPQQEINELTGKIDAMKSRLSNRIDSLNKLPNPNTYLVKSLDSIRGKLDSLKNSDLVKNATNATNKVKDVETKINGRVTAIEGKINEKLGVFHENGMPGSNVNLPKLTGGNSLGVKNPLDNLNTNIKMPNNPIVNPLRNTGNLNLNMNAKIPNADLSGLTKMTDIKVGGLQNVQEKIGDFNKVGGKINSYSKDAKTIVSGDLAKTDGLSKDLEQDLLKTSVLKDVQKDLMPANNYTDMIKKWNSDPEYAKELMVTKAKEQAVNHFAGHEQQLNAAMSKLGKMKQKYADAESTVDIFRKPVNPMKGKPFVERLVPAFNLQFQSATNQWFDFNTSAGYRWTGRWTTGIGWTERLGVNFKRRDFVSRDHAYGARTYLEFKVKDNFHLRGETEYLNAFVNSPYLLSRADTPYRMWVWSYFGGVKKSFDLSKNLRGNVQVLYNLYDPHKQSPYISRLNLRMGFEFPMKQKVKVKSED